MAAITVKVRKDIGDPGVHLKFGQLVPGASVTIDEVDFADGLFERPKGFISPLEKKDKDRADAEGRTVGNQEPVKRPETAAEQAPAAETKKEA